MKHQHATRSRYILSRKKEYTGVITGGEVAWSVFDTYAMDDGPLRWLGFENDRSNCGSSSLVTMLRAAFCLWSSAKTTAEDLDFLCPVTWYLIDSRLFVVSENKIEPKTPEEVFISPSQPAKYWPMALLQTYADRFRIYGYCPEQRPPWTLKRLPGSCGSQSAQIFHIKAD